MLNAFQDWVANTLPGWKTKFTVALGAIGNAAFVAKDYLGGLPLGEYLTTRNLTIANVVLFTLAYWFRGLGERETTA